MKFSGALDPKKCDNCGRHTIFYERMFDEDFRPYIACDDCIKESKGDTEE